MSNLSINTKPVEKKRSRVKKTVALSAISKLDSAAQVRAMIARNSGANFAGVCDTDPPAQELTERENHVIFGIAHGLSNANIGTVLGISPRTVEIHRKNLIRKLGASNSADAVRIAVKLDMV